MADIYVYDTGSNTAPYDTVAKAATSLETAVLARGAGEKILMDYRHREDLSAGVTYTPGTSSVTDPCMLRSVDTADSDAYRLPTDHQIYMDASDGHQDIELRGNFTMEGCWLEVSDDLVFGNYDAGFRTFDCKFMHKTGSNSDTLRSSMRGASNHVGAEFNFGRIYNGIRGQLMRFFGCTFITSGADPIINSSGWCSPGGGIFEFCGCDLSALGNGNGLWDVNSVNFQTTLRMFQCKLPSSYLMLENAFANQFARIEGYGCDDSDVHADFVYEKAGDVLQDSAIYADAGFDDVIDGRFSNAMTSSSDCKIGVDLTSLFFGSVYTGGTGSKTFTVGCVHDFTALTQADVGLLVYYLGTSGSAAWDVSLGIEIGGATTALASHSADWTGATGKTKVNLTATATVNQTGFYAAQVVLRKYESGKKFWFDPVITVS